MLDFKETRDREVFGGVITPLHFLPSAVMPKKSKWSLQVNLNLPIKITERIDLE